MSDSPIKVTCPNSGCGRSFWLRGQEVLPDNQVSEIEKSLKQDKIFYFDPSYDKAFKRIVCHSEADISRSILDSFLSLVCPKKLLSVRESAVLSEAVSGSAASGGGGQNLLADCVFDVKGISLPDSVSASPDVKQNNEDIAWMLSTRGQCRIEIEMQRKNQAHINTRLLMYLSKMFSEQNMSAASTPLPVVGFALCAWGSRSGLSKEVVRSVTGEKSKGKDPSGMYGAEIFLGTCSPATKGVENLGESERRDSRKKFKERLRRELINHCQLGGEMVATRVSKQQEGNNDKVTFSDLKQKALSLTDERVRSLYEWLCFFGGATLMDIEKVKNLLDENVQAAYKLMEIEDIMNKEYVIDQVYDVWGRRAAEEELEATKADLVTTKADLITTKADLIQALFQGKVLDFKTFEDYIKDPKLQMPVFKELKTRNIEGLDLRSIELELNAPAEGRSSSKQMASDVSGGESAAKVIKENLSNRSRGKN